MSDRELLVGLALVVAVALAGTAAAGAWDQESEPSYTRAGHAACVDLDTWESLSVLRNEDAGAWYLETRQRDDCFVTRDSTPVEVRTTDHERAVRIRRLKLKRDTLWWVDAAALYP